MYLHGCNYPWSADGTAVHLFVISGAGRADIEQRVQQRIQALLDAYREQEAIVSDRLTDRLRYHPSRSEVRSRPRRLPKPCESCDPASLWSCS